MATRDADGRGMTFLSADGLGRDADRDAILAVARPSVEALRSILLVTGLTMTTSAGTGVSGADTYLRNVSHPHRRMAVDAETGDLYVESLDGGLDREPLTTIAEVFGARPETFLRGSEGRMFIPIESSQVWTAATCVKIATRCDDFTARSAVEVQIVQATAQEFVRMLVTAVIVSAGRGIAIRNDRSPNRHRLRPLRPGDIFRFGHR